MVKQRMASADVAGEVSCLKSKLLGLRLANIYDLSPKTYVLKLAKSGADGEKVFLLLESGARFHTVQVMHDKPDAPSNFTLKLRKHLRTRRLEDVRQLGVDRVVDFVFGTGPGTHHLLLEMYASGNVILTDADYTVLTLLRSHRDDAGGLSIMARHPYPMHAVRLRLPLARDALQAALDAAVAAATTAAAGIGSSSSSHAQGQLAHAAADQPEGGAGGAQQLAEEGSEDEGGERLISAAVREQPDAERVDGTTGGTAAAGGGKRRRGKGGAAAAAGPTLKGLLSDLLPYGPAIAEHCCRGAGLDPGLQLVSSTPLALAQVDALHAAVERFEAWLASLDRGAVAGGFITATSTNGAEQQQQQQQQQQQEQKQDGDAPSASLVYQDYNPLRLEQLAELTMHTASAGGCSSSGREVLCYDTFDDALDEFYGKLAGQRQALARLDAERSALSRLDRIRADQGARANTLEREAAASEERASLIEYNLEAVDAAIDAVNAAIATGMDWRELETLIRDERRAGNPVAGLIHSLQLDQNKVTLLLSNLLDEEEEDESALTRPATKVQVDLALSAYSNAAVHHTTRKKQLVKQEKTLTAHAEALRAAEKKAAATLTTLRNSAAVPQVVRKVAWYERFSWFISSENYLVISGRDAQQNELIVKRYFRKGDVYVHAELHGASSTIVRNHDPSRPVPPLTLQQAGAACVCRSRAWDSKLVTSAWWVHHHQVSKTAPSGEYLPTGSFMVRGRKNFLPPQALLMGFGFMFKLEDSCIGHHAGERAVRGGVDDDAAVTLFGEGGDGGSEAAQRSAYPAVRAAAAGDSVDGDSSGRKKADVAADVAGHGASALDDFLDLSADQLAARAAPHRLRHGAGAGVSSSFGGGGSGSFDRYGLQHAAAAATAEGDGSGDEDGGADGRSSAAAQAAGRRYMSAAERARQKKAGKQQTHDDKDEQQQERHGGAASGVVAATSAKKPAAVAAVAPVKALRGKKAKAAKAKERYAQQDEEDREMALMLLGSSGTKKTRQDRRAARKAVREEARAARVGGGQMGSQDQQEAIRKATASQFADVAESSGEESSSGSSSNNNKGAGRNEQDASAASDAVSASAAATATAAASTTSDVVDGCPKGSGPPQANRDGSGEDDDDDEVVDALAAAADEAEAAEIRALLAEENVADIPGELGAAAGDHVAAALRELDSLTGQPRPDDVLLHAVPVCGPWAALERYKFKVKLTPGTLKKGKAVRQAMELLTRGGDVLPRERDLMRAVPDTDMVAAMVGTVKISAAGLQQLKAASKQAKKAAAKGRAAAGS